MVLAEGQRKRTFLDRTGITIEKTPDGSRGKAMRNSLNAALRRNPTYQANASRRERSDFRNAFASQILGHAARYKTEPSEDVQVNGLIEISDTLTRDYGEILRDNCLRLAAVQKATNLYLKFLWCLETDYPAPRHCPIDTIVLRAMNVGNDWTKLKSIDVYLWWISDLKKLSAEQGHSLASWELQLWNAQAN